jgi:hypothetical protein
MSVSSRFVLLGVCATLFGCGGGLKLTPIKSSQTRPSNVAAYFKVQTSNGEPVGGLTAEQFRIYEDDQLVSTYESKQVILNPEVAASHYTMLLVDTSGSIAESGAIDSIVEAAAAFTERVEKTQKVGVYAFDGCEKLHPIAPFTSGAAGKAAVSSLKGYKPDDPSTNLNGAVVKALAELDTALSRAEHPMRFGTLVVFSDGTDRAARISKADMEKAVGESKFDIFAIGLGAEMKESELKRVGKTGTAKADNQESVVKAFDTVAARVEAQTKSYYLLSYCSPARAGKHKLRIEAIAKDAAGKSQRTGSFESEFDASGFSQGCDPNQRPNFDLTKGDALAPKEVAKPKGTGGEGAPPKKPQNPPATPTPKVEKKPAVEQGGDVFNP